jgi:hypothetical protein
VVSLLIDLSQLEKVVVIKKECRKIKGRNIRSDYGQISAPYRKENCK